MKDPNRIYKFQGQITRLWMMYPELRYTQLMDLISKKVSETKGCNEDYDIFYIEDDVVEQVVNSLIEEAG